MSFVAYIARPGAEITVVELPQGVKDQYQVEAFVAQHAGLETGKASMFRFQSATSIAELREKAVEAGFKHRDDVPPVPQGAMDQSYDLLTQLPWTGTYTKKIDWSREDNVAIAVFQDVDEALQCVRGYLISWTTPAFRERDTEETELGRGLIRDEHLSRESLAYTVEIPKVARETPLTVRIPLDFFDVDNLRVLVERGRRVPAHAPTGVPSGPRPAGTD